MVKSRKSVAVIIAIIIAAIIPSLIPMEAFAARPTARTPKAPYAVKVSVVKKTKDTIRYRIEWKCKEKAKKGEELLYVVNYKKVDSKGVIAGKDKTRNKVVVRSGKVAYKTFKRETKSWKLYFWVVSCIHKKGYKEGVSKLAKPQKHYLIPKKAK